MVNDDEGEQRKKQSHGTWYTEKDFFFFSGSYY